MGIGLPFYDGKNLICDLSICLVCLHSHISSLYTWKTNSKSKYFSINKIYHIKTLHKN